MPCQGTEQRGPLGSIQLYRRTHPHSADPLEPECLESPPDSLPCFKSFTLYPLERRSSPSRLTFSALAHFRLILGLENAISRNSAYEAVKLGDIPSLKIGRRIIVPKAALDRMLEGDDLQSSNLTA